MTYVTTVNGITLTMEPAVAQTLGPSGATIQFTSKTGTGGSLPIRILFSTPVKEFGVTVVGQTNPNHRLEAYDIGGTFIGQAIGTPIIPDMGKGGSDVVLKVSGNPAAYIASVKLIPPTVDYVGYKNLVVVPVSTTEPPPPTDVDLAKLVIVSTNTIDRTYMLGSMKAVPSQVITFTNTSTDTALQLSLTEQPDIVGMSFSPSTFPLNPKQTSSVTVLFDYVVLNTRPVADLISKIVVKVSKLGVPIPPPPPPPPTQLSWYEERFGGSPLRPWPPGKLIGPLPTYEQLFSNPILTQTIPSIQYFNTLTAPITLRWTQNITVTQATDYFFTMVTDDGMRFYINDTIIMNEWRDQDDHTYTKGLRIQPGQYTFRVEYFNNGAGSTARFGYTTNVVRV
jgi:PA14 domain